MIDSNERASAIIQKLATTTHDTEPQPSIDTSSVAQSHSIETARSTLSRNNPVLEPVVENSPSDPSDDSRPNSGGFPPDTGGLDSSGNAVTGGSGLGNRMSFSRRNSVSKEEVNLHFCMLHLYSGILCSFQLIAPRADEVNCSD